MVISESDIQSRLKTLKTDKSPGPDSIHPRIVQEVRIEIASALKIIYDLSICSGVLPDDWKSSIVSAIHKR
jgi:hypothetical protein